MVATGWGRRLCVFCGVGSCACEMVRRGGNGDERERARLLPLLSWEVRLLGETLKCQSVWLCALCTGGRSALGFECQFRF